MIRSRIRSTVRPGPRLYRPVLPPRGVRFHPESLFTEHGRQLVGNALRHLQSRARAEGIVTA